MTQNPRRKSGVFIWCLIEVRQNTPPDCPSPQTSRETGKNIFRRTAPSTAPSNDGAVFIGHCAGECCRSSCSRYFSTGRKSPPVRLRAGCKENGLIRIPSKLRGRCPPYGLRGREWNGSVTFETSTLESDEPKKRVRLKEKAIVNVVKYPRLRQEMVSTDVASRRDHQGNADTETGDPLIGYLPLLRYAVLTT